MTASTRCTFTPDCEFGPHGRLDHPCGQRSEKPGEPCRYCGDPVPGPEINEGSCPNCWRSVHDIPLADLKGLFAAVDLSLDPVIE